MQNWNKNWNKKQQTIDNTPKEKLTSITGRFSFAEVGVVYGLRNWNKNSKWKNSAPKEKLTVIMGRFSFAGEGAVLSFAELE